MANSVLRSSITMCAACLVIAAGAWLWGYWHCSAMHEKRYEEPRRQVRHTPLQEEEIFDKEEFRKHMAECDRLVIVFETRTSESVRFDIPSHKKEKYHSDAMYDLLKPSIAWPPKPSKDMIRITCVYKVGRVEGALVLPTKFMTFVENDTFRKHILENFQTE